MTIPGQVEYIELCTVLRALNGIPMAPSLAVRGVAQLALEMFVVNGKDWVTVSRFRLLDVRDAS